MYRCSLLLRKSCDYLSSGRGHIVKVSGIVAICACLTVVDAQGLMSFLVSQSVNCEIACHATYICPRILAFKHCIAGPPCPLEDILNYIFSLGNISNNAQRKAVDGIADVGYQSGVCSCLFQCFILVFVYITNCGSKYNIASLSFFAQQTKIQKKRQPSIESYRRMLLC